MAIQVLRQDADRPGHIMNKLIRIAYGAAAFFMVIISLRAEEVRVLASANAQAIPLFVLAAKQDKWMPGTSIEIVEAAHPEDAFSLADGVKTKHVQYGVFNIPEGARAYEQGVQTLQIAASFLWGAPLIVTRPGIYPGDWAALAGATGVTAAPAHMPLYELGKAALRRGGISDRDINLRSVSKSEMVNMMNDERTAPVFAVVPEPEVTKILAQQNSGKVRYQRFADVTTVLDSNGLPLGGVWVINNPVHAPEFLKAFKKAVSYAKDQDNVKEVSTIVVEGYKKYFQAFPDVGSAEVSEMLKRGNVILRYKEAGAIKNELMRLWQEFGMAPDKGIFYVEQGP